MQVFEGWFRVFTSLHPDVSNMLHNKNNPFNFFNPEETKIVLIIKDSSFVDLKFTDEKSETLKMIKSDESKSLNFKSWLVQGILLLNYYDNEEWKKFIDHVVSVLQRDGIVCYSTFNYSELIKDSNILKEDDRLMYNFDSINYYLININKKKIIWNNSYRNFAFTDGGCIKNGKSNAVASFSALIEGATIRGLVKPYEYKFIDENDLERGICNTEVKIVPTNNRGEILGLIYGFLGLLIEGSCGEINIWSDSKICVNTLLTWLPNRIKKGTEKELKNYDLVMIAWKLLELLRKQAITVNIHHINSHTKEPPATAKKIDKFVWKGNHMADRNSTIALSEGFKIINGSAKLNNILG